MPLKLTHRHNSPNWYIRGTIRGIPVDESTKTHVRETAEAIRAKREVDLLERSVFGRTATATFLEAAVSYMEAGGETRFMERIIAHFGTTPLVKIDQTAIDQAAAKLYPVTSAATRNRQLYTPVSAVLKHAAARGLCEERRIERPSQPTGRIRWLKPEEAERLIDACSPHMRTIVVFLLYTGARCGEALWLDWHEVDLQRRHVTFLNTKNETNRGVPLHPRIVAELANLPGRNAEVFRRPDGMPFSRPKKMTDTSAGSRIKTAFKGACNRAKIENFSPHDCRHTWATWHYAANRDLIALKELGGWKSERMVLRYAHINVDHLTSSIEALPWGISGETENHTHINAENRKA